MREEPHAADAASRPQAHAAGGEADPTPSAVPPVPSMKVFERIEAIRKPACDTRSYRFLRLPNQLQVMLVSDPAADKAAASMDVAVGHACDPPGSPGLAHFLEHMLFLGTSKYPDEAEYQGFLAQNGGSSNAYTAFENTNYHFEVVPAHLAGALDRFAQFFLAPLFTESATGRELSAIDSENSKNLQSDQWRMAQLSRWMASPDHPQHKFGTGNSSTLVDLPARPVSLRLAPVAGGSVAATVSGVCAPPLRVRDALIAFHAKHYSANAMRLCVLGRQSSDDLEAMVLPLFAPIPNTDRLYPVWGGQPYARSMRRALVSLPVRQLRLLTVLWPLPPIKSLWRSKPYRYISHLLGHESEGSLLSLLKDKGWVDSLCAGESASASDFAVFELQVRDCIPFRSPRAFAPAVGASLAHIGRERIE
jgi:insulysin